jgi:RNA polymerase sigma factor (sigma-70 family)
MHVPRDHDTDLGGTDGRFPRTRHSALVAAKSSDPETRRHAFETICAAYWKPVYQYVRLRWNASNDDAKELTQGFLMRAFERDYFQRYDPARAAFRTFLRVCLDRYVAHEREAAQRLKRGGDALALDVDDLDESLVASDPKLDADFHREWTRALFEAAVERFRARCESRDKQVAYELFDRYDLKGPDLPVSPTYEALAAEFGVSASQVTNHLAWARREFKDALLSELRSTCVDDDEFHAEARALLGIDPS